MREGTAVTADGDLDRGPAQPQASGAVLVLRWSGSNHVEGTRETGQDCRPESDLEFGERVCVSSPTTRECAHASDADLLHQHTVLPQGANLCQVKLCWARVYRRGIYLGEHGCAVTRAARRPVLSRARSPRTRCRIEPAGGTRHTACSKSELCRWHARQLVAVGRRECVPSREQALHHRDIGTSTG